MRKALAVFAVVLSLGMTMALDAEAARRLGGGKSSGMQRQNVEAPAPGTPRNMQGSPSQAAPAAGGAAAAAAAAPAKRSWMGPIAGLAAGLGLMALASHFGFGAALANMMMIGLLVMAVVVAVAFFMRKRAAAQRPALAGAGAGRDEGSVFRQQPQDVAYRSAQPSAPSQGGSLIGSRLGAGVASAAATGATGNIPADFDTAAFERNAKTQFLGLQSANDARDLDRLREYLTPEMFDLVRAELAQRGDAPQETQVFGLDARVLDVAEEGLHYVVSVHFSGSVRDEAGAEPETLDEIWHLSKPRTGGGWVVAGIQQRDAA